MTADVLAADARGSSLGVVPAWPQRGQPVRLAYLTNIYPLASHSFIRREILALERLGVDVLRLAVRDTREELPDPDDQREKGRTTVLLDGRIGALLAATVRVAIGRPACFVSAIRTMLAMSQRGSAGLLRHLAYLLEACRLVTILNRAGVRHMHVHFGTNPAAVARLAKTLGGPSYSLTVHGPDEFDAPQSLSLPQKLADSNFTVAISDFGRGQLMRWSAVADWPKIKVVRCGIDHRFLDAPAPDANDPGFRSATLVCVARLSAQKGLPLLLEAAAEVAADGLPFEMRLIGDGELRPRIEARIRELDLERYVRILGWRSADAIRSELLSARAFILPSFAEGLPVALMEALALGRPVITTAIAGVPELVDSGCGWLVPSGSVSVLACAIRSALTADPNLLATMGRIGRERVRAHHNIDANAAELARLLVPLAQAPMRQ